MENSLIIIKEYSEKCQIDSSFIDTLVEEGLIELQSVDNELYIHESQLPQLEKYTRWHYDLSINVAGISAIDHLLGKMEQMRREMNELRSKLGLFDLDLDANSDVDLL
ncbi:MAG: chaperone modulator CbpM [Prevotellaceae bacterium]|nr:chaperone modulator CbpM [Prevotellaceae bacterium]